MMRFTVLASGSKANATVIEADGYRVLIDCGLSLRELTKRLAFCGLDPTDLDALLITHFHSDHVRGVPTVLQKIPLEVFSSEGLHGLPSKARRFKLYPSREFELGPFKIVALALPHDHGGSLGFIISNNSQRFVYATDLGYPTAELAAALQSADATMIESNHDLEMLNDCAYPNFVKERIRSEYGHLSNCQSAHLLSSSLTPHCQHVVLAHLSERANTSSKALKAMRNVICNPVSVASQSVPTQWFNILPTTQQMEGLTP